MASTISCASCSDDLSPSIHRMLRLAYLIAMSGGWALRVYDERQFAQITRSRVARPLDNWAGARDQPDPSTIAARSSTMVRSSAGLCATSLNPRTALKMTCAVLAGARASEEPSRTLCKRITSVSPGTSGHWCQTDRAPMLVGTPLPVNLSVFVALGPALWIRRPIPDAAG